MKLNLALLLVTGLGQQSAMAIYDPTITSVTVTLRAKGSIQVPESNVYKNDYTTQDEGMICAREMTYSTASQAHQYSANPPISQGQTIELVGELHENIVSSAGAAIFGSVRTSLSVADGAGNKLMMTCRKNAALPFSHINFSEVVQKLLPGEFSLKVAPLQKR